MDKTRKLLLRIAGVVNIILLITAISCIVILSGSEKALIDQIMAIFKDVATSQGVEVTAQTVMNTMYMAGAAFLIVGVLTFVFASFNAEKFRKYKFFLLIPLVFSFSITTSVLILVCVFVNWKDSSIEQPKLATNSSASTYKEPLNSELNSVAIEIENLKRQKDNGLITEEQYNKSVSAVMKNYADKEIDNGN